MFMAGLSLKDYQRESLEAIRRFCGAVRAADQDWETLRNAVDPILLGQKKPLSTHDEKVYAIPCESPLKAENGSTEVHGNRTHRPGVCRSAQRF